MTSLSPHLVRIDRLRKVLLDDTAPVTALYFAGVAAGGYDMEIASMTPEAFLAEIETNINHGLSDFVRAKIVAGQLVYSTDQVYKDLPTFVEFANLTNIEDPPVPGLFNPADSTECALAVLEITLIDPAVNDKLDKASEFAPDILRYWGAVMASEGAVWAVQPLQLAILSELDDFADPAVFEVMDERSRAFQLKLQKAVWEHAINIFNYLKLIPSGVDDEPLIRAAAMQQIITELVGEQAPADSDPLAV